MRRLRWTLLVVVTVLAALASGVATHSALSQATAVGGNGFATGTVDLEDNDAGQALLSLTAAEPGATDTGCILVTYNGSLDAAVRLYADVTGALAPYLTVTITRGTDPAPAFGDCAGFTAEDTDFIGAGAGVMYTGTLAGLPAAWDAGIADGPDTWTTGESHAYRISITLVNDIAARGLTADAAFVWEARNL